MSNERQPISLVRGSSKSIHIMLTDANGEPYELAPGEVLRFAVKRSENDTKCELVKEISSNEYEDGKYILNLTPKDTLDFKSTGDYYYDIGLQIGAEYLVVIESSPFTLRPNISSVEV